jgi:hypothetical protein
MMYDTVSSGILLRPATLDAWHSSLTRFTRNEFLIPRKSRKITDSGTGSTFSSNHKMKLASSTDRCLFILPPQRKENNEFRGSPGNNIPGYWCLKVVASLAKSL